MTTNLKNSPNSSLLKDARLSKGLTLDIVHEATKIPMDALRAIEEGYSTRILTPFYYRGFIKIYAEFLGLSVNDVLKEYNAVAPEAKIPVKTPIVPVKQPSTKSLTKPTPPKAPINKSPNALSELLRTWGTPKNKKNLLRIIGAVVALFMVMKIVGCVVGAIKSRPKSPSKNMMAQTKKQPRQVKKESSQEEVKPKVEVPVVVKEESQSVSAQSTNHKVTLTVHASKDSAIQVRADGKIVFQMTMRKGTVENWEADKQIELSGKNIGDLDLEVNGKEVSSMGHRAKKVVITKDGLSVKK
jgi:cytoskeleton protein RodZ